MVYVSRHSFKSHIHGFQEPPFQEPHSWPSRATPSKDGSFKTLSFFKTTPFKRHSFKTTPFKRHSFKGRFFQNPPSSKDIFQNPPTLLKLPSFQRTSSKFLLQSVRSQVPFKDASGILLLELQDLWDQPIRQAPGDTMLRGPSVRVVDDISPIIHFVIKKVIVTQNQPMRLTNLPAESHQFTRYDVYPVAKAGMDESLTGIWYDIDMARHEAELLNQCSEVQDS